MMGLFGPNIKQMLEKKDVNGLIAVLKGKNRSHWLDAYEALANIGAPAVDQLVETLRDRSNPSKTRCLVADTLGRISDQRAFEPLTEISRDEKDNEVLGAVLEVLMMLEIEKEEATRQNDAYEIDVGIEEICGGISAETNAGIEKMGVGISNEADDLFKQIRRDIDKKLL